MWYLKVSCIILGIFKKGDGRIMKRTKASRGFTLIELLVVIGIIAILCAVSIPAIASIRDSMLLTQADQYAKSIFLAAQQNLTQMRAEGGLESIRRAEGAFEIPPEADFPEEYRLEYVYTVTGTDAFRRLLPPGSADADILDDPILIEYNPLTGNVYGVFYGGMSDLHLADAYRNGNSPRQAEDRRKLLLGYYDGSGLNSSRMQVVQLAAAMDFLNGEEGILQLRIPVPESYFGRFQAFASALDIRLTITGDQTAMGKVEIPLKEDGHMGACRLDTDGKTLILEYTLDSLTDRNSFANIISNTQGSCGAALTSLKTESAFSSLLPGENITIQADINFYGDGTELIRISPAILSGINPMFAYLQPLTDGSYAVAIANGRHMQNLNVIAPSIASRISSVTFIADIDWNDTTAYYNSKYGGQYANASDEAPARALPYFVPIHSEALFGSAHFYYPGDSRIPSLNNTAAGERYANIRGVDLFHNNGIQIRNLNIDSCRNSVGRAYYAGTSAADQDRFTGLFSYVNCTVDNIHIVNPIINGYRFAGENNPATGALAGCAGSNSCFTNCSVYLDMDHPSYSQDVAYGVRGDGAVGGLVGYVQSSRTTDQPLIADSSVLTFYNCFAAIHVTGNLREESRVTRDGISYWGYPDRDYGLTNGIGGLVGIAQTCNFYNCYASGNVTASNTNAAALFGGGNGNSLHFPHSGGESAGAGGFAGTSHGSRYTNCFATGSVNSTDASSGLGAGGFVGIMCIDGGSQDSPNVQLTVFTDCYCVGQVTVNGGFGESFSGGSCRRGFAPDEYQTPQAADYYQLLASTYSTEHALPDSGDFYIFRNSYFLSRYQAGQETNSAFCAAPATYADLQNLTLTHQNQSWIRSQIHILRKNRRFGITCEELYFNREPNLETICAEAYGSGYASGWEPATGATTHGYNQSGIYPFSKIKGLDYYGDWPAQSVTTGIAYYESYCDSDTNYFYLGSAFASELRSGANYIADRDGYAILSASSSPMTITVNGITAYYPYNTCDDRAVLGKNAYHVYLLNEGQMEAALEYVQDTDQFYAPVTVVQDGILRTYYFSPCLAMAQATDGIHHSFTTADALCDLCGCEKEHTNHWPQRSDLYIRSARHFALLCRLEAFLSREYRYIQQLSIDGSAYLWNSPEVARTVSIGNFRHPFEADYLAAEGCFLAGFQPGESGLFGCIGETGSVAGLTVYCSDANILSEESIGYAAVLAGLNQGIIEDITLHLRGNVTVSAPEGAGLLAGLSTGSINGCHVYCGEDTQMRLDAPIAGGLIGLAQGREDHPAEIRSCTLTIAGSLRAVAGISGACGVCGAMSVLDGVSVILSDGALVSDQGNAAGFALAILGTVQNCGVTGPGIIQGTDAAGFAVEIQGAVLECHVSPALTGDPAGYLGRSNRDLKVQGTQRSVGFALTIHEEGTITHSSTLCAVFLAEGSVQEEAESLAVFGFVGENAGRIQGCTANVDITNGFAFAGINDGLIATSYGWYNDENSLQAAYSMTGSGLCTDSYFADLSPADTEAPLVIIYDSLGDESLITLRELADTVIPGFDSGFDACPYDEALTEPCPYPMLRSHYGDWLALCRYAYGIAYYEIYGDGTFRIHLQELSDPACTEEGRLGLSVQRTDTFDEDGIILRAGYAMFYNSRTGIHTGTLLEDLSYRITCTTGTGEDVEFSYDFYALEGEGGVLSLIPDGPQTEILYVDIRFADAFHIGSPGSTFQIRTAEQLSRIGQLAANYIQTHDITTIDVTPSVIQPGCTYDGGGRTLTILDRKNLWLTGIHGSLQNLTIFDTNAEDLPLFGDITGAIENVTIQQEKGAENP